jgi:hypothetical protein
VVSEEVVAVSSIDVEVASNCAKAGLTMKTAAARTMPKTLAPANATVLLFMNTNIVLYKDKLGLDLLWIFKWQCIPTGFELHVVGWG